MTKIVETPLDPPSDLERIDPRSPKAEARLTMARIAALRPGQSPPPVSTAIFIKNRYPARAWLYLDLLSPQGRPSREILYRQGLASPSEEVAKVQAQRVAMWQLEDSYP